MKKKLQSKGSRTGTGTLTSEEIVQAVGGDIAAATGKVLDHYKGRTQKLYDQRKGVTEIRDVIKDDYDHQTEINKASSEFGDNPIKIQKSYDRKALKEFTSDEG